jgi:hypothetical protein
MENNVRLDRRGRQAASLLAAFRHLGLPDGDLRKASIQTLRFRLFEVPGRLTRGQRKIWLHLRADWPCTTAADRDHLVVAAGMTR